MGKAKYWARKIKPDDDEYVDVEQCYQVACELDGITEELTANIYPHDDESKIVLLFTDEFVEHIEKFPEEKGSFGQRIE